MTIDEIRDALNKPGTASVGLLLDDGRFIAENRRGIKVTEKYVSLGWLTLAAERIKYVANNLQVLSGVAASHGSDPELFFVNKFGDVVPSTVAIGVRDEGLVVNDGIQGELHPYSNHCRQIAASNIGEALQQAWAFAQGNGAKISFEIGIEMIDEQWKKTPMSMRRFGCNPSLNAYGEKIKPPTGIRERFRAAGGHLHIGCDKDLCSDQVLPRIIKMCDLLVANTFVIIDRDENNARRRRYYGRAGDYRKKSYGFEYRTLSNFWLRHYTLWSMSSGLTRQAMSLVRLGCDTELMSRINEQELRDAINNNDRDLAIKIMNIVLDFFEEKGFYSSVGLSFEYIKKVRKWINSRNPEKRLDNAVKPDIDVAISSFYGRNVGMEKFFRNLPE